MPHFDNKFYPTQRQSNRLLYISWIICRTDELPMDVRWKGTRRRVGLILKRNRFDRHGRYKLEVKCAEIEFGAAHELSQLIILPPRADLLVCNRGYQISRYIPVTFCKRAESARARACSGIHRNLRRVSNAITLPCSAASWRITSARLSLFLSPPFPLPPLSPKLSAVSESCIAIFDQS